MNFTTIAPTISTTKNEIDELCTHLRELLAEIKGYFTQEEKESFCPAFYKHYQVTFNKAVQLGKSKCRSKKTMERRENMLIRCNTELSEYLFDYMAVAEQKSYQK